MDKVLKTNNLTKKYNSAYALNNLSIEINRSDIYGLIGLNGAGKTTLMKIVLGLINKTAGSFELFENKNLYEAKKLMNGFVEAPTFYPHMTAYQNLKTHCLLFGLNDKKAIYNSLEIVGLKDVDKKKVRNYSLGMKQRLGIARALVTKSQFIILDEPTNGLDPEGISDFRKLIFNLNKKNGTTFLISSHYLSELQLIATKYGIIDHGKLLEETSANTLLSKMGSYTHIQASNLSKARELIKTVYPNLKIDISDDKLIYNNKGTDVGKITSLLSSNGIQTLNIESKADSLEEYVLRRVSNENAS